MLFVPPKHPLEFLFVLRDERHRVDFVSNSVCFCLAAAGVRPGSAVFERIALTLVESTNVATARGVYGYDPVVIRDDQVTFLRILHNNFSIEPSGRLRFSQGYLGRQFSGFGEYRAFLSSEIDTLFANAMHPARRRPLPPLASVSSGYDSTAVAVLARERRCRDAVTIEVEVGGVEDSGRMIGEQLGLTVEEFPHVAGRRVQSLEMAFEGSLRERAREFVATAGLGDDVTFLAFEPVIASRLLLTGAWGDSIWAKNSQVPPGIPVRVRFGKSLIEYRLRMGFAHAPIPFIGGLFPRSILAISNSVEMAPYSVGGFYDRPIPRRIAEGAGIDRRHFGRAKAATSPDPLNHPMLWRDAVGHVMKRYAPDRASR